MRVAIIGSGISGLSAAWLLNNIHDIVLYEANDRLGGHSHTVDVPSSGGPIPVDTGFIVYNEQTYPNLVALFDVLDVASKPSSMSFGVSIDQGRFEYAGSDNPGALFAQKRNLVSPRFQRMLVDIVRFNKAARQCLADGREHSHLTLGAFVDRGRFGSTFINHYLLPMCAAIWSASFDGIRSFPAASLLRFFDNHGLLNLYERPIWRTVEGGSRTYVEKLSAPCRQHVRLSCPVRHVVRTGDEVLVTDAFGDCQAFDAVVLACHADQALRMINAPSRAESEILGAFRYQTNRAVLHTDTRLMPLRRGVWSSWNYLSGTEPSGTANASVTYWLNRLQAFESEHPVLVSLNPLIEPDEASVIMSCSYDHPQFDLQAMAAQMRLPEIQGHDRLWFAGAHWGYGFHEDGLLSGLHVAAELGAMPPWWSNVMPLRTAPAARMPKSAAMGGD